MTDKEKLEIVLKALFSIANKFSVEPYTCTEEFDGDYNSASGGNFDDAADLGRQEAYWDCSVIAREAMAEIVKTMMDNKDYTEIVGGGVIFNK